MAVAAAVDPEYNGNAMSTGTELEGILGECGLRSLPKHGLMLIRCIKHAKAQARMPAAVVVIFGGKQ